jgi:hypothetical protein
MIILTEYFILQHAKAINALQSLALCALRYKLCETRSYLKNVDQGSGQGARRLRSRVSEHTRIHGSM